MNASSAKKLALKIVVAWKSKDRARRRHEHRLSGTTTLDMSDHPEVVEIRRELEAAWPPDMLMSADQRDAFIGAMHAYAVEHGVTIITAQQQPVLRDSE